MAAGLAIVSSDMVRLDRTVAERFGSSDEVLYHSPAWTRSVMGRISTEQYAFIDGAGQASAFSFVLDAPSSYRQFDPVRLLGADDPQLGRDHYPALVCAVPNAYVSALHGSAETVRAGAEALLRLAERRGCATVAVLYTDRAIFDAVRPVLMAGGMRPVLLGGTTVLDFRGSSPATFLDTFPSHRRRIMRKEREAFAHAGLTIEEVNPLDFDEVLAAQQLMHYAKFGINGDIGHVMRSYAQTIDTLGDHLHLLVIRSRDGARLGFLTTFLAGKQCYPRHLGFDVDRLDPDSFAYFNIAYYGLWATLPDWIQQVVYGPSAYHAKTLRGCAVVPLYGFLRLADDALATRLARDASEAHESGLAEFHEAGALLDGVL